MGINFESSLFFGIRWNRDSFHRLAFAMFRRILHGVFPRDFASDIINLCLSYQNHLPHKITLPKEFQNGCYVYGSSFGGVENENNDEETEEEKEEKEDEREEREKKISGWMEVIGVRHSSGYDHEAFFELFHEVYPELYLDSTAPDYECAEEPVCYRIFYGLRMTKKEQEDGITANVLLRNMFRLKENNFTMFRQFLDDANVEFQEPTLFHDVYIS